jgi:hypothetical protein
VLAVLTDPLTKERAIAKTGLGKATVYGPSTGSGCGQSHIQKERHQVCLEPRRNVPERSAMEIPLTRAISLSV